MTSARKLRNIGFKVDDEWLGTLMLAGLPDEYKPMIMGIESSGIKISADMIKTKLLQEVKTADTTAFYTKFQKKTQEAKNKDSQPNKAKGPRCFNCNKHGHMSKQCWFKKKKSEGDNSGFVAAFSANIQNDSSSWYVDSGASAHMTMHRDWLENETAAPVQSIRIADNKALRVESCGNVTIKTINESTGTADSIQVRNVLFVPELSTNLLSVSKIVKSGCKIEFSKNGCEIKNKIGQKVAEAKLINDTYKLDTYRSGCAMAAATEDSYLWHQRMGHLNFNDLRKLSDQATGIKLSTEKEEGICTSCLEAKQTRQPFNHEGSRAAGLLELIHTDVCGPMETLSLGGARYFLTFIDDYSRKVIVYFLKNKSEVLEKFIDYKNQVENELNRKIKILRSDNGTEYKNNNFDKFLRHSGIKHQTSNPYTPEQNGLSERMNRTLVERAKCMLLNSNLQKEYWAEAIATAAYIINRSPTRALSDVTPHEAWTNSKPDLSHIRVFGCKAMVHIPKEKRLKLDPKSRELTFIGYSDCTKGYRFIDQKTKRVLMSRDVVFLEATVKRNKIITEELKPENEKENMNTEKLKPEKGNKSKESEIEKQINKTNNFVYLPITETEKASSRERNEIDDTAAESSTSAGSTLTDNSSVYDDPLDETYVPDESLTSPETSYVNVRPRRGNIHNRNDAPNQNTFLCVNGEMATSFLDEDPQTHEEALNSEKAIFWKQAMDDEYRSLIDNNTWSTVDIPVNKKVIPCKWVYKTKRDEKGNVSRYKARLVIKGYKQVQGIDYNEVYAPVVRYTSLRYLFGLAAKYELKIHQMDAVTAFLQGDVEEEIYMSMPPCFEQQNKVCRLNKALYGLKQASRQWNKKLNVALIEIGMTRSLVDSCIYYRIANENDILFITVYVDDLLYFFNCEETALIMKGKLKEKFKIVDMGKAKQCIGYRITQNEDENEIYLDQSLYIRKILNRFGMYDSKPVPTPYEAGTQLKKAENKGEVLKNIPYQEAMGCLLYLSQGTRPDITYAVSSLSRFNNSPTAQHWVAVKRIFRYLRGTINFKLTYKGDKSTNTIGFCDANWATDCEDRRSTTGYIFLFQGAPISWNSKRQPTVALSSTEAEYMSLATATQEALWLKQLEVEYWPNLRGTPLIMYCDNQSTISLSGSDGFHARSKHIDVRYHFVKEKVATKQIQVLYRSSQNMIADVLTKGLLRVKHEGFVHAMGLRPGEDVE